MAGFGNDGRLYIGGIPQKSPKDADEKIIEKVLMTAPYSCTAHSIDLKIKSGEIGSHTPVIIEPELRQKLEQALSLKEKEMQEEIRELSKTNYELREALIERNKENDEIKQERQKALSLKEKEIQKDNLLVITDAESFKNALEMERQKAISDIRGKIEGLKEIFCAPNNYHYTFIQKNVNKILASLEEGK